MKTIAMVRCGSLALAIIVTAVVPALGQGFANLDFESANVTFVTNSFYIASGDALPGWSFFSGTNQQSVISYNGFDAHGPQLVGSNAEVIAGNFDVYLVNGDAVSQTGLVPAASKTLLFDAIPLYYLVPMTVSLGGQSLSFMAISNTLNSSGTSYTVYGANISAFAGQVETLTFTGGGSLDDIRFSSLPIPEPAVISLVCLGSGVLLFVRNRRRVR